MTLKSHTHNEQRLWTEPHLRTHLVEAHGLPSVQIAQESFSLMKGRHRVLHEQQEGMGVQVAEAVTPQDSPPPDPISLRNQARSAVESLYMEYHAVMHERDYALRREEILTKSLEQLNSRLVGAHEKLVQLQVDYDSLSERLDVQTRMLEERPETFVVSAKKAKKIQRKARDAAERERNAL